MSPLDAIYECVPVATASSMRRQYVCADADTFISPWGIVHVNPASSFSRTRRLEPCAVHLVAGLAGAETAVGVLGSGAMVDDAVDLPRDRH